MPSENGIKLKHCKGFKLQILFIAAALEETKTREKIQQFLVNLIDDSSVATLILALQYQVMLNQLVYFGVCGASKWAGDQVEVPSGRRQGLQLLGKQINVV